MFEIDAEDVLDICIILHHENTGGLLLVARVSHPLLRKIRIIHCFNLHKHPLA
jgi:hypothetical protein